MLIYTIIEYTDKGTQGVKSFITEEECNIHYKYLREEFPNCDFEILTAFCDQILNSDTVYEDGC